MNRGELLSKLEKSKFDLALLIIVFLLIFSSQILTTQLLRGYGTIIVTDGAAIPQESNYTISTEFSTSVTTAVVFNYTLDKYSGVSFNVITDNVSRFCFNITLQSTQNNTDVNVLVGLGYRETFDIMVGTTPTIVSLELNMTAVHSNPGNWIQPCRVLFTTDVPLEFKNVLLWAEFDTPVSPVILNWQSTDGNPLFANPYTSQLGTFRPELGIKRQNDSFYDSFDAFFQNRTLYLRPQNYSMRATWGGDISSIPEFYLSITENSSTICTLRMKAVRLSFSIDQKIPLIHLQIMTRDFPSYYIYNLYFQDSEKPEFLFIPPIYDGISIWFDSMDPLSSNLRWYADCGALKSIPANGTYHQNIKIQMPYWYFFGFIVTQLDFIHLSVAMILFSLVIIRTYIYLSQKKPRGSWRNPHFIPAIILGLTTFMPWFYSIRETVNVFDTTIHVAAFGTFPLVTSWTDSGIVFLDIPPSGIYWAILSLFMFWFPLICFIYGATPTRDYEKEASILLFLPYLYLIALEIGLGKLYTFAFDQNSVIPVLSLLIPSLTVSYLILKELMDYVKKEKVVGTSQDGAPRQ